MKLVVVAVMVLLCGDVAAAARIELTATPTRHMEAAGPIGRAGNTEHLRWWLSDRKGRRVGVGLMTCYWHRFNERVCRGVIQIGAGSKYGTLVVQGISQTRSVGTWAVTGGTHVYRDWGDGELRFTATGFGKLTVVITT